MVRRSLAAGAGLLVLILLILAFRGCLNSRSEQAVRDYIRDVGALSQELDQQRDAFFSLLNGDQGGDEVQIQNALNEFNVQIAQLSDRAAGLDHPGDLDGAHAALVEAMQLRSRGVEDVARCVPEAITDRPDRRQSTACVAYAMQILSAGDVIYQLRGREEIDRVADDKGLAEEAPESVFLDDTDWLNPDTVTDRIGGLGAGGGGAVNDEDAAPGLHGNGLAGVTLGGQALTPGGEAAIKVTGDLAFEVQVANQGENTETDVKITVSVGSGGDAIEADATLDTIAAGETKPVEVPLSDVPPTGQTVPITVTIEKVPGEEKLDNNEGEFSAIFTR